MQPRHSRLLFNMLDILTLRGEQQVSDRTIVSRLHTLLYMLSDNAIMASASIQQAGAAEKQTCPAACNFSQCYQVKRGNGNNDIK